MRILFVLTGLFFCFSAQARDKAQDWQLLVPNAYHGGEAPARPGRGWLALTPVDGNWRLVPAVVHATAVVDNVLDEAGQKTGIKISSSQGKALALLRLAGIRAGTIDMPDMEFDGGPQRISKGGSPLTMTFKGEQYAIAAIGTGVYLRKGRRKTRFAGLWVGPGESEDSAALLWAGDLDGDGQLDFLFAYSGQNAGGSCLYLSTGTSAGPLVKKTACHGGIGC